MDVDDKPNAVIRETAAGLTHVHDLSLLEPFVDQYFAALFPIWESRSYHISEELIEGLFPAALANERVRAAGQAWLDAHTAHSDRPAAPALRRLVIESLAGVERALAAQAADDAN